MRFAEYYAVGFAPYDLVKIEFRFSCSESKLVPFRVSYNACPIIPTIFASKDEAMNVLELIKTRKDKVQFWNNSAIDSILEEKHNDTSHSAINLRIFTMKVEE